MGNQRNAWIDITRVAAAMGIILCHTDMTGCGAAGILAGQFLSVRFSLMFFLAVIGFYVEKAYQAGNDPIPGRVRSLIRLYGAWSLVYLTLSFVMVVLIQKAPLGQFLIGKVIDLLFSGSYYHFWFYPAVIYGLLFIGGIKKLLGENALRYLVPRAMFLYVVGLLGTGYLPLGQQIPGLQILYAWEGFEDLMHLCFLGFPSLVFGMAAARSGKACCGYAVLIGAAAYVAESVILCLVLDWQENPQMLISTPLLTVLFLRWIQSTRLQASKKVLSLCRGISAGIYNVHPLILAVFGIILPGLKGIGAFALCAIGSAMFGWVIYSLRNVKPFGLFV